MKYEFSTSEIKKLDGSVYKICSRCGKPCRTNYGLEIKYNIPNESGNMKRGLCKKCAYKLSKHISKFVDTVLFSDFALHEEGNRDF